MGLGVLNLPCGCRCLGHEHENRAPSPELRAPSRTSARVRGSRVDIAQRRFERAELELVSTRVRLGGQDALSG